MCEDQWNTESMAKDTQYLFQGISYPLVERAWDRIMKC